MTSMRETVNLMLFGGQHEELIAMLERREELKEAAIKVIAAFDSMEYHAVNTDCPLGDQIDTPDLSHLERAIDGLEEVVTRL